MEQFQEYLLWKLFIVKTDNNPLTYIMATHNLDATWHHCVESLTGFTFSIKYLKGWDRAAADVLSQVSLRLHTETVRSILDGVTMGSAGRADAHDPVVAKQMKRYIGRSRKLPSKLEPCMCVNLHMTDWVAAQWEDSVLKATIEWIPNLKVQNMNHLLGDDVNTEQGMAILREWRKLMLYQGALYYCHTPTGKLEEVLWFVVSMGHQVAAMKGCHSDAGH